MTILMPPMTAAYADLVLSKPGNPALWPLDDPAGSATARELSGRYAGTVVGGLTLGGAGPLVAGEAVTAGTFSAAQTGIFRTAMPTPAGALTIGAWIQPTTAGNNALFNFRNAYTLPTFLVSPNSTPLFYMSDTNFRYFGAINILDGLWHLLIATLPGAANADVASAACYLDGVALSNGYTYTTGAQESRLTIEFSKSGTWGFIGSLALAFVAGAVWTAADAKELYLAAVNGV